MSEPITPNDPHANAPDEDPEQHLGPEVADPWADVPVLDVRILNALDPKEADPRDSWPGY